MILDKILTMKDFVFNFEEEKLDFFMFSFIWIELFFVFAKFLVAMLAGNACIGCFGKTFGMTLIIPFPTEQQHQRERDKAIRVGMRNEYERREHHCKIPVIDAAVCAASVLHKPGLEGAEEEDADHVAHGIGQGDQQQDAFIEDARVVQRTENGVQGDPGGKYREGHHALLIDGGGIGDGNIVFGELLLTTGAFQLVGEEPQQHIRRLLSNQKQ